MKVLLALDGSAPALVARDLVRDIAWPDGTRVDVVSAYDVPMDWTGGVGSTMDWVGDAEDAVRDGLAELLGTESAPLARRGLIVEAHAVKGRAAEVVVDVARRQRVDLIVTGSRGRGPLRSMLLGSVASAVVAEAPCPVLVARRTTLRNLLVATDGSPGAMRIPSMLGAWGILAGVPAAALAVAIPDPPAIELITSLYTLGRERVARWRGELRQAAEDNARGMADRLNAIGIPAQPHVRSGDPAAQILAHAEEADTDLIVTGSRGLSGLERAALGSVARNVLLHAGTSVLVVRSDP